MMSFPARSAALLIWIAALLLTPCVAQASSVLVWPVDPVIDAEDKAVALWIENKSRSTEVLQLRIFAWTQIDGEDLYAEQSEVVGTPPMIRLPPGGKQLIRLTRRAPMPPGVERAFRILIDEIPSAGIAPPEEGNRAGQERAAGIRFQMRYSIPLFVYGDGLWWKPSAKRPRDPATAGRPALSWRIVKRGQADEIEIRNSGPVHARLVAVRLRDGDAITTLSEGLFGYVLAGGALRRPLPVGAKPGSELEATINGGPAPERIVRQP